MSEFVIDRLISTAHALKESRAYSASVVEEGIAEITRLRQLLSEAEKREREARAKALEEAEKVAEAEYKRHCTGSGFDSQPARSTAHRILEALKALQSEER